MCVASCVFDDFSLIATARWAHKGKIGLILSPLCVRYDHRFVRILIPDSFEIVVAFFFSSPVEVERKFIVCALKTRKVFDDKIYEIRLEIIFQFDFVLWKVESGNVERRDQLCVAVDSAVSIECVKDENGMEKGWVALRTSLIRWLILQSQIRQRQWQLN